jgi:hypothetical protein
MNVRMLTAAVLTAVALTAGGVSGAAADPNGGRFDHDHFDRDRDHGRDRYHFGRFDYRYDYDDCYHFWRFQHFVRECSDSY